MPITPPMPRNIQFRVETVFPKGVVGRLRPDENGIYKGLPMMVLGEVTQQQTYYDPQSLMDQVTSPTTRFNMVLQQGKMFGEYGHPSFLGFNSDSDKLQRLTTVEEKNVSHVFTSLYTDPPATNGSVVLRADIKPFGPMGSYLKEGLDDPIINTAFSLRAFVDTKMRPDGLKYRVVRSLTTFDCVGASGYKNTDKANALGLESFAGDRFLDYDITVLDEGHLRIDQIALESFTDTDLNEIFGTSSVAKIVQSTTFVQADPSLQERFPTLYGRNLFHDYFKEI